MSVSTHHKCILVFRCLKWYKTNSYVDFNKYFLNIFLKSFSFIVKQNVCLTLSLRINILSRSNRTCLQMTKTLILITGFCLKLFIKCSIFCPKNGDCWSLEVDKNCKLKTLWKVYFYILIFIHMLYFSLLCFHLSTLQLFPFPKSLCNVNI